MLFGNFFNWLSNWIWTQCSGMVGSVLGSFNVITPVQWNAWMATAKTYWGFANYLFPADLAIVLLLAWFAFLGGVAAVRWFLKFIPFIG